MLSGSYADHHHSSTFDMSSHKHDDNERSQQHSFTPIPGYGSHRESHSGPSAASGSTHLTLPARSRRPSSNTQYLSPTDTRPYPRRIPSSGSGQGVGSSPTSRYSPRVSLDVLYSTPEGKEVCREVTMTFSRLNEDGDEVWHKSTTEFIRSVSSSPTASRRVSPTLSRQQSTYGEDARSPRRTPPRDSKSPSLRSRTIEVFDPNQTSTTSDWCSAGVHPRCVSRGSMQRPVAEEGATNLWHRRVQTAMTTDRLKEHELDTKLIGSRPICRSVSEALLQVQPETVDTTDRVN